MDVRTQRDILVGVTIMAIVTLVAGALMMSVRIHNTGRIIGIGVDIYWNKDCTDQMKSIDWGSMRPGQLKGVTAYIKNVKNTNATLSFTTDSWNPTNASKYLTFSWNYTAGKVLKPAEVIVTQLTLLVDPAIHGIDTFSFDTLITGIEYQPAQTL